MVEGVPCSNWFVAEDSEFVQLLKKVLRISGITPSTTEGQEFAKSQFSFKVKSLVAA